MAEQGANNKRDKFKRYLEGTGVVEALTKALIGLYEQEDKPSDPIVFVKRCLGETDPTVMQLRDENTALRLRNDELQAENDRLKAQLAALGQ